jgi:hypothetical protein
MAHRLRFKRGERRSAFYWIHKRLEHDPISPRKRLQFARSLEGVLRELSGPVRLPGASPLNRIGLRPYEQELAALSMRLADLDQPVTPAGMQLVRELLTDGGSPLYDRARAAEVPETIDKVLKALEPR